MSIGVIGGLGPMATAVYMKKVINMTDASTDQEHPDMIIYSCPKTPDRTAFILGKSDESPLPSLVDVARRLDNQGVKVIAVPCITARYFNEQIKQQVSVPVIHGVDGSAKLWKRQGITKVGILATEGSIRSGVIQKVLENNDIEAVIPDEDTQKLVTSLIYDDVKKGKKADLNKLNKAREALVNNGAEVCLLGCTELSVIADQEDIGEGFFDILDMLAAESIDLCGYKVRDEYKYLLG